MVQKLIIKKIVTWYLIFSSWWNLDWFFRKVSCTRYFIIVCQRYCPLRVVPTIWWILVKTEDDVENCEVYLWNHSFEKKYNVYVKLKNRIGKSAQFDARKIWSAKENICSHLGREKKLQPRARPAAETSMNLHERICAHTRRFSAPSFSHVQRWGKIGTPDSFHASLMIMNNYDTLGAVVGL